LRLCKGNKRPQQQRKYTTSTDTQGVPMLDLGDWRHWTVTPRLVGTGEHAPAFLIVKPEFSGQETTLTVPTDKRIYYIRLLSEPHDYLRSAARWQ